MKLVVKICTIAGDKFLMLCDEQGKPLPNQRMLVLKHDFVRESPEVQVTFVVDSENVRLFE